MDIALSGKTALVTGASAGIGRAIATALAGEGVRVAITARRDDALRSLAAGLEAAGAPRIATLPADITRREDRLALADAANAALGGIDILVNCAGASRPVALEDDGALWDESYALNFEAVRHLTHLLIPAMRTRGWGRVITVSGNVELRGLNAAAAAKAGLHVWAKGLSCLVAKDGVTINTIVPGRIWSEQIRERLHPDPQERDAYIAANIPIGRFGEPEELANLAVFLASPLASYITGVVVPVDGGMRHSPH